MKRLKYDKEYLESCVIDSTSIRQVLRILNLCGSGASFQYIKSKILEYNIDIGHFMRCGNRFSGKQKKLLPLEALVKTKIRRHRSTLKRAMIEIGIDYICSVCGIQPT